MKTQNGTPIDKRNLIKRINRALASRRQRIETARLGLIAKNWGEHYLVDVDGGPGGYAIVRKHVHLPTFARKVGALRPGERLASG
jgi:hypothetical protein